MIAVRLLLVLTLLNLLVRLAHAPSNVAGGLLSFAR